MNNNQEEEIRKELASLSGCCTDKACTSCDTQLNELRAFLTKHTLRARIEELENVYGLLENDVTIWTDVSGMPLRQSERIREIESELQTLEKGKDDENIRDR